MRQSTGKTADPSPLDLATLQSRKPARRGSEIPPEVMKALANGWTESLNLVEWLNVDRVELLKNVLDQLGRDRRDRASQEFIKSVASLSALKKSMSIGQWLADSIRPGHDEFSVLANHRSDVVREWASVIIGHTPDLTLKRRLAWMKTFADDNNAGLREVAWISFRHHVIDDPSQAISCLVPWTGSRNERLRRYASEVTRPRGVWAPHVEILKSSPELAEPILEPLRDDSSKYVRDSVANWLNDASKSRPDWVKDITNRWTRESDCDETRLIVKRALRTLEPDVPK